MIDVSEIIKVIKDVFGEIELPICIVVLDSEGLELFSTANCPSEEATNVLGIMAYEQMNEQIKGRLNNDVDLLMFRIASESFFVAPIVEDLYLLARTNRVITHITPLLEGIRSQIAFRIKQMKN